jgi:hypothetical protein
MFQMILREKDPKLLRSYLPLNQIDYKNLIQAGKLNRQKAN